ncbi:MAG: hypothetical protein PHY34_04625 [Patescibacteria group bacterium]|nr:hypothetical protein [Patescibacteria group bacterium]
MNLQFTLTMDNFTVHGKHVDSLIIVWEDTISEEQFHALTNEWVCSLDFLARRIRGLTSIGETSLSFTRLLPQSMPATVPS